MKKIGVFGIVIIVFIVAVGLYFAFSSKNANLAPGLKWCGCAKGETNTVGNIKFNDKWPLGDCRTNDDRQGHRVEIFTCKEGDCIENTIVAGDVEKKLTGLWDKDNIQRKCVPNP